MEFYKKTFERHAHTSNELPKNARKTGVGCKKQVSAKQKSINLAKK